MTAHHHAGHGHLGIELRAVDAHHAELFGLAGRRRGNRAGLGLVIEHDVVAGRGSRGGKSLLEQGSIPTPVPVNSGIGQGPLGVEDEENFHP